jgi:flagellar basal body-associated protein FliL
MEKESEKTAPAAQSSGKNFTEWRWPVVILSLGFMVLVAFLYSINAAKNATEAAKDATIGAAKEIRETV